MEQKPEQKRLYFTDPSNRNDPYWRRVSAAAAFIAARLTYEFPRCNGTGRASTIRVDQHKEKFGCVRVYCTLAWSHLVKEHNDRLQESGNRPETIEERILKDARHYRLAYLDAVALAPDLETSITIDADYPELLLDNVEEMVKYVMSNGFVTARYRPDPNDALELLKRVYDLLPTFGV